MNITQFGTIENDQEKNLPVYRLFLAIQGPLWAQGHLVGQDLLPFRRPLVFRVHLLFLPTLALLGFQENLGLQCFLLGLLAQ